jgi:hypothetical protein
VGENCWEEPQVKLGPPSVDIDPVMALPPAWADLFPMVSRFPKLPEHEKPSNEKELYELKLPTGRSSKFQPELSWLWHELSTLSGQVNGVDCVQSANYIS